MKASSELTGAAAKAVVVVLDNSGSMRGSAGEGKTKLEAAKEGADTLLAQLDADTQAALVLLVLVVPLLFPLRGLLHGRKYTFAWSCFLALLYFTHGVMEAYSDDITRPLGLLEIMFSSLWFLAAMA